MNYEEFHNSLKRDKVFDKYMYGFFAMCIIVSVLYILFSHFETQNRIAIIGEISILFLGFYVLYAVIKLDKFTIVPNKLSLEENSEKLKKYVYKISSQKIEQNYTKFTYFKDNIWKTPYEVFIYAGDNFIAINAKIGYAGIVDLGASTRTEKKILKQLSENIPL